MRVRPRRPIREIPPTVDSSLDAPPRVPVRNEPLQPIEDIHERFIATGPKVILERLTNSEIDRALNGNPIRKTKNSQNDPKKRNKCNATATKKYSLRNRKKNN